MVNWKTVQKETYKVNHRNIRRKRDTEGMGSHWGSGKMGREVGQLSM